MKDKVNQYIIREYEKLNSGAEKREFLEKIRFLMMAGDKDFNDYYSNKNLTRAEFYSVMDALYELNNLWLLEEFIRQNSHILIREVSEHMEYHGVPDFTEPCRLGSDTMLSRMFQVMQKFHAYENTTAKDVISVIPSHSLKIYAASTAKGKEVPQIVLQGNWVEQWGFCIGSAVRVECYPNKLVILKEGNS